MGPALNMAASSGAYVLSDRGTWLSFKNRADQELLAEMPEALAARLRDRVEGPAGIMLGAHGPEAVALSIAARLTHRFGHV